MRISAYCENRGWLFEDLKRELRRAGAQVSELPDPSADAWICIRTSEHGKAPDKARTVLQVHDVTSKPVCGFGAVSYVHPAQARLWGIAGHVQPIGARDVPASGLPVRPTIGFFCRDKRGEKRPGLFCRAVDIARKSARFDVLMIGHGLDAIAGLGEYDQRAAEVSDYARVDAIVTTSVSPMVPLSAYEAAAAGRAVITTPREWDWPMVRTGRDEKELAALMVDQVTNRRLYAPRCDYTRAEWARAQVELARSLAG